MAHERVIEGLRKQYEFLGRGVLIAAILCLAPGCIFFQEGSASTVEDPGDQGMGEDLGIDASMKDDGTTPDLSGDACELLDCVEGMACEEGACVCNEALCAEVGERFGCSDGACVEFECVVSEQCAPGQQCQENTCEDIVCQQDMDCPEGLVCEGQKCEIACTSIDQCPGSNSVCLNGRCANLLEDSQNCGAVGNVCQSAAGSGAGGRQCVDGFCLCENLNAENNSRSVTVFSGSTYKAWPEAQLIAYPTFEHYRCSKEEVALERCEGEGHKILFNDDYPLTEPHFIAVSVKAEGQDDRLIFRTLSGRGGVIGGDMELTGLADVGQKDIINYRLLRVSVDRYLVLVQWRGEGGDRIDSYYLRISSEGMGLTPVPSTVISPGPWVQEQNVTDFSVSAMYVNEVLFVGMAYTTINSPSSLNDGGKLYFKGFALPNWELASIIREGSYDFEQMRQFTEGMAIVMRRVSANQVRAHVLAYDSKFYGDGTSNPLPNRVGQAKAYANLFTFEKKEGSMTFDLLGDATTSMGGSYVSELDILGAAFSGDRTVTPADSYLFWNEDAMLLQRIGWDFVRQGAASGLHTKTVSVVRSQEGEIFQGVLDTTDSDLRVFDAAIAAESEDEVYVHHVEQSAGGLQPSAKVILYGLTKNVTSMKDEYTVGKVLTPAKQYRRVTSVPGPHATGVLVTSSDRVEGAELYFVASGGEPVCN